METSSAIVFLFVFAFAASNPIPRRKYVIDNFEIPTTAPLPGNLIEVGPEQMNRLRHSYGVRSDLAKIVPDYGKIQEEVVEELKKFYHEIDLVFAKRDQELRNQPPLEEQKTEDGNAPQVLSV